MRPVPFVMRLPLLCCCLALDRGDIACCGHWQPKNHNDCHYFPAWFRPSLSSLGLLCSQTPDALRTPSPYSVRMHAQAPLGNAKTAHILCPTSSPPRGFKLFFITESVSCIIEFWSNRTLEVRIKCDPFSLDKPKKHVEHVNKPRII
jgi:hypothetical protein